MNALSLCNLSRSAMAAMKVSLARQEHGARQGPARGSRSTAEELDAVAAAETSLARMREELRTLNLQSLANRAEVSGL